MITLIGMGSGTPESLTAQGLAALQNAGLILGAKRLLEQLPQGCTEHRKALYQSEDVLAALAADPEVDAALVYSGDTGFYSGAAQLLPMLRAFGISCRVLPGLSSVQLLAAAVGRSWQEWKLVSAHGCACDPVAECLTAGGKPVFLPDRRGRNACLPLRPAGCCRAGRCPCAGGRRAGPGRGKDPVRHGAGICAKAVCKPERSACGASSSAAPAGARLPG